MPTVRPATPRTAVTPFQTETKHFQSLSAAAPVLLFPVRIETRFLPAAAPTKLRIRILPDQLMIDEHDPRLSTNEYEAGRSYWATFTAAGATPEQQAQAWEWLAGKVGQHRAAFVSRDTRVPNDKPRRGEHEHVVSTAPLLPDRWLVVGFIAGRKVIETVSQPVAAGLKFSPDFKTANTAKGLSVDANVRWMFDFNEAVKVGMAVDVTLTAETRNGVDELYVLGIKTKDPAAPTKPLTPERASGYVAALFEAQLYTRGAAFAPQGTPTNNTDDTEAGSAPAPAGLPAGVKAVEANYRTLERALGLKSPPGLKQLDHADGYEGAAMEAMNTLLWGVTLGEYLGQLLLKDGKELVPQQDLRRWFRNKVRGGAPLPCVRLGSSPYGVLPVLSWASLNPTGPFEKQLKETLSTLHRYWQQAESTLVQLTETTQGSTEPGERLLELLSMQPNPVEFSVTGISNDRAAIHLWYELLKLALTSEQSQAATAAKPYTSGYLAKLADESSHQTIEAQIATAQTLIGLIDTQLKKTQAGTSLYTNLAFMKKYLNTLKELFSDHDERANGLRLAGVGQDAVDGRMDPDVKGPAILFSRYDTSSTDWDVARNVVVAADGAAAISPAQYFDFLRKYAESKLNAAVQPGTSPFTGKPRPLLFQLVYTSIGRAEGDTETLEQLVAAIDVLKGLPPDQLELLMQQTLGLAGWRLDAWFTSFATDRLTGLRRTTPLGVQIGAFGWVEKLKPQLVETGQKRQSHGFIHAPSLNHAKTAAVLKSGWLAYKEEQNNSALAIDLSSSRVRTAAWLFDAVRQGQDLGEALGYRFERALSEAAKQYWIAPVRSAVLKHSGGQLDPRAPVVDGMELLALWNEGKGEATLAALTKPHFTGSVPAIAELKPLLLDLIDVVDAMADLAIADSTHALVQGNYLRAGSSLAAISRGEIPPPELQVVQTSRKGITLTHRVMLVIADDDAKHGWFKDKTQAAASPRAMVAPQMENLVAQVLGAPGDIRFDVGYQDADGTIHHRREFALSELLSGKTALRHALGAQDVIALAGQDTEGGRIPLEDWILFFLDQERPADVSASAAPIVIWEGAGQDPNLSSRTLLWLQAWRDTIQQSRPLDLKDFTFEDSADTGTTRIAELEAQAIALRDRTAALVSRIERELPRASTTDPCPIGGASVGYLAEELLELARFNIVQAIPDVLDPDAQLGAYYAALRSAFDTLNGRFSAVTDVAIEASLEADERFRRAKEIIHGLLGKTALVSAGLIPGSAAEVAASLAKSATRLAKNPAQCHEWLEKMQYVSAPLRAFSEALLLHDALGLQSGGVQFAVGQWPDHAGEAWVGMNPPTVRENGRFTILAGIPDSSSPGAITAAGAYLSGLLVDEIVERLPADEEDTAVAIHFDAPNTEPPQVLLLAMAPDGRSWTFDLLCDTVRETLGWARRRAVDREHITLFDHHLPAVFAGKDLG